MRLLIAAVGLVVVLSGCAGPHGERPYLDNAVVRPNSTPYSFTGGYAGATAGTGPKNDPGAGPNGGF